MKYWMICTIAWIFGGLAVAPAGAQDDQSQEQTQQPDQSSPEPSDSEPRVRRLQDSLIVDPEAEWVPSVGTGDGLSELERTLVRAEQASADGNLIGPSNGNALSLFQAALAIDSNNSRALDGIQSVATALVAQAQDLDAQGDREGAMRLLDRVRGFQPSYPNLDVIEAEISGLAAIQALIDQAESQLASGRVDQPAGDNALQSLRAVLALDGQHARARQGLQEVEAALLALALNAAAQGDFAGAEAIIVRADAVQNSTSSAIDDARTQVAVRLEAAAVSLREQIAGDIRAGRLERAQNSIQWLVDNGYTAGVNEFRQRLADALVQRNYFPGAELRDPLSNGGVAPALIVIGAGQYTMGSSPRDSERLDNESPPRSIRFGRPFALAQTEVTVAQFRAFVADSGYVPDSEKNGESTIYNLLTGNLKSEPGVDWRRDYSGQEADEGLPVVHVSWNDARAFVTWLSGQTGQAYRLPSEAEFEYALRAGSSSRYWWGDGAPSDKVENLTGDRDKVANRWEWPNAFRRYGDGHWGPAPVASYPPNPFGLHDIGGNVMEWVGDCYQTGLDGVPNSGEASTNGDCSVRTIRGGAWASPPAMARSAYRSSANVSRTSCLIGFRVARDL